MSVEKDRLVLSELKEALGDRRLFKETSNKFFHNEEVAKACGDFTSKEDVERVLALLKEKEALNLNAEVHSFQDTDEQELRVTVLRASLTDLWPMGTHYWIRDNALVGGRMLNLLNGTVEETSLGKDILLSALTLISTKTQLKRFKDIITKKSDKEDAHKWPHIFFDIKNNLNTAKLEPWMHIQDAWQMLAVQILTALQSSKLSNEDLSSNGKEFLSLVIPFLSIIDHTAQENAGSWEELVSKRNSVLVWEYKLICLVSELASDSRFLFLQDSYKKYIHNTHGSFSEFVLDMKNNAYEVLKNNFPYESGTYQKNDPRYRGADAALIALLELNFINDMCSEEEGNTSCIKEKEGEILSLLSSLEDPRTKATARYKNDSYQGTGYFRPSTAKKLSDHYGAPSGDASGGDEFVKRREIVPEGPEAFWLHFIFQLSSWAGKRFHETKDRHYFELQREKLLNGLALITGDQEFTLHTGKDNLVEVVRVKSFRIPECYITDTSPDGDEMVFPSPHTPLNWAVSEARYALSMMFQSFNLIQ